MQSKKVLGIVIVATAAAAVLWFFLPRQIGTPIEENGSVVELELRLKHSTSRYGITVVPLAVTDDSRCPIDVVCVWAGTVKVNARVTATTTTEREFELGVPVLIGDIEVQLTAVSPVRLAEEPIDPRDYRFRFNFKKIGPASDTVPIQAAFEDKIVYTADQGADISALRAHCAMRNGTFNECGSPCAPDAAACITVCAFTCDLPR